MVIAPSGSDVSPSMQAFKAAGDKTMQDMNRPMSGDADRDFVEAETLPQHQGAVEIAKVELKYGADPELRKCFCPVRPRYHRTRQPGRGH